VLGPMFIGKSETMKTHELLPFLIQIVTQQESEPHDRGGIASKVRQRLEDIQQHATSYYFSCADRMVPWVVNPPIRSSVSSAVLTPVWDGDRPTRRAKLASTLTELIKANKRILLIAPDNVMLDEVLLASAKALRGAGLQYKSFLCRYEPATMSGEAGINLTSLSFDTQVSTFLGKAQSDKAGLRRRFTRYLELIPVLRYKSEKQKDLDEVRHLEWRLLSALGDVQAHITRLQATLSVYDTLPVWQRVGMQVVGSNVATMKENCELYEAQKQDYLKELETAQTRIAELKPEAYIDPELRPEYDELKEEISRLGGLERVKEVLATEEDTARRPFLQAKRVLAATAHRVATDTIFTPLRYDALVVDEAPRIALPLLFICACMTRERIVLSGNIQELPHAVPTEGQGLSLAWPVELDRAVSRDATVSK
jgi:hypothetical protein